MAAVHALLDKPLSGYSLDALHARIVDLGEAWAELDGAASLLEENRKSVLARLANAAPGSSQAAREACALASPDYDEHIRRMVAARVEATKARVRYDSAKTWVELARSLESSRRAEMSLR